MPFKMLAVLPLAAVALTAGAAPALAKPHHHAKHKVCRTVSDHHHHHKTVCRWR